MYVLCVQSRVCHTRVTPQPPARQVERRTHHSYSHVARRFLTMPTGRLPSLHMRHLRALRLLQGLPSLPAASTTQVSASGAAIHSIPAIVEQLP